MSSFPMRRLLIGLRARYHLWNGRRAYRMGAYADAGAHFLKVIQDGFESFEAHLALGKIHLRKQDFHRAGVYLHRARVIDPALFMLEGFPDDFVDALRSERPPVARPHYRIVIETRDGPVRALTPPAERKALQAPLGDFCSRDEMRAHRARPALRPDDWQDVDWDAEARQLFDQDGD